MPNAHTYSDDRDDAHITAVRARAHRRFLLDSAFMRDEDNDRDDVYVRMTRRASARDTRNARLS